MKSKVIYRRGRYIVFQSHEGLVVWDRRKSTIVYRPDLIRKAERKLRRKSQIYRR